MADVVPGTPQAQKLQDSIQKQLAFLGWSTEDDNVMAEYVLVMLGNRKTPEQISTELSDLIGGDFDTDFVSWLFEEVKKHYPETSSSAASPSREDAREANGASGADRRQSNGSGPTGRGVFGAAMSGVKRDARDLDGGRDQPPQQRQRTDGRGPFEGVPSGPRGGSNGPGPRRNQNGPAGGRLIDRLGPPPRQRVQGAMGMPPQAFDMISQAINAVNNGAHPSALAGIPFPALASHPQATTLPPQVMAQAQAAAMAQAQAFAAMQNAWTTPFGQQGPPPPGFNPQAAAFQPGVGPGPRGGPPPPMMGGRPGPPMGRPSGPPGPPAPPAAPTFVLPTRPTDESICKHGVKCTKPQCPYSHPSPVATEESGLVLSSEACEKQLECEDKDCPKSHVSPSQKTAKTTSNAKGETTFVPPPKAAPAPPVADPTSIPGAGERPCKFGGACTRPGCVFLHPWDVRGDSAQAGSKVPCRWGASCTRPDCHFGHPPNRPSPYSKSFGKPAGASLHHASKYSATFNKPGATKPKQSIGDWPKEDSSHVSERLKRFAQADGQASEKIIPGESIDAKVEIDVEDEPKKTEA